MAKTITGYTTIGVTLAVNPTDIAGTIATTEGAAITGSAAKTWTVANHGTVKSSNFVGIDIAGGLKLSNAAGALISGKYEGVWAFKSTSISNAGTITATARYGAAILLEEVNASITNSASGVITGGFGIESSGNSTILNKGMIDGTNAFDAGVLTSGTLDNAKGGTIIGGVGVELTGLSTLIDAGLIEAAETDRTAIVMGVSAGNEIILESGATIIGSIVNFLAGDTIDETGLSITSESFAGGTLTLYDGTAVAGRLELFGGLNTSAFVLKSDGHGGTDILLGAATFTGSYSTDLELSALSDTIASTAQFNSSYLGIYASDLRLWTLLNEGTILAVDSGVELLGGGTIINAAQGLIESQSGFGVQLGPGVLIDSGTIIGSSGHAIYLVASTAGGTSVSLEAGAVVQGAIAGFGAGDTIDLAAITATGATYGGGTLSLTNAGVVVDKIALDGLFTGDAFRVGTAAGGGTDITMAPSETFAGQYGVQLTLSALFTSIAAGALFGSEQEAIIGHVNQNWTLVNSGTAEGFQYGVQLERGQLTNTGSGLIEGNLGVRLSSASLVNGGTIIGTRGFSGGFGAGIVVDGTSATARNLAGGSISSVYIGADIVLGTLTNAGAISGTLGVELASATLLNSGRITGLGGPVYKTYIDTGLRIIDGFASNATAGIIAGPTGARISGGTLINAGHILGLPGGYREGPEGGSVAVASAGIVLTGGAASNTGTGTISGAYGAEILGGTLIDAGTLASTIATHGTAIAFGTAAATLVLDKGNVIDGAISGFIAGDVIDFAGTTIKSKKFSDGILTLKDGAKTIEKLSFTGSLTTADFTLVSQGTAGTELIVNKSITSASVLQFLHPDPAGEESYLTFSPLPPAPQPETLAGTAPADMCWLPLHPTTPPPLVPAVTLHSA